MKKLTVSFLAVATLGFAVSSNAQQLYVVNPSSSSSSKAGAYVGVGLGVGGMNTPKLDAAEKSIATSHSESIRRGVAGRAYAGYFWQAANFLFGPEIGASTYPKNKYRLSRTSIGSGSWTYSGYNIDLLGIAKYAFDSGFNIFGKAGLAYAEQKVELKATLNSGASADTTETENDVLPEVAAGLGFDWTDQFSTNITYSHIFGNKPSQIENSNILPGTKNDLDSVASIDMVLLNAEYHFG